jgi:hypothetical protein
MAASKGRAAFRHFPFLGKLSSWPGEGSTNRPERITRLVAIVDRRIQRTYRPAAGDAMLNTSTLGHLELLGKCLGLFWPQVPILQSRDSALRTSQF